MLKYSFSLFVVGFASCILSTCESSDRSADQESAIPLPDSLQSAEQFALYGIAQMYQAWDFEKAGAALEKAIEMNPNMGLAQGQYGWFLDLNGRMEEAAEYMKKAVEVEPNNPQLRTWKAWHCLGFDDYDCTRAEIEAVMTIDSTFPEVPYVEGLMFIDQGKPQEAIPYMKKAFSSPPHATGLGMAYALSGEKEKALAVVDTLSKQNNRLQTLGIAGIYVALGDNDAAFEWVEKAYEQRHPFFPWNYGNPELGSLREEQRFKDLMAKVELPSAEGE